MYIKKCMRGGSAFHPLSLRGAPLLKN